MKIQEFIHKEIKEGFDEVLAAKLLDGFKVVPGTYQCQSVQRSPYYNEASNIPHFSYRYFIAIEKDI